LAAIRHELTDRVPVDVICIEIAEQIAGHLNIDASEVSERLGLDGRLVAAGYTGPVPDPTEQGSFTPWGTINTGDYGTTHLSPLTDAQSVLEVEQHPWPDPDDYDYNALAERARSLSATYAVRGPYWHPLFCRVCDLFGMETAMMHMASGSGLFEAALERVFEHTFEYCRQVIEACGDALDIFCIGDDFATQRGLMVSPEHWRRLLKPRFARLFEMAKQAGKYVWMHSCGDITSVLPDLIDIGMDVWETVQIETLPVSAEELKREYGPHITFFGGVSTQRLPFRSPERIRSEVEERIRVLGKGGGYICGPDHHIKPDVAPELAVALFDSATAFRGEGCTL